MSAEPMLPKQDQYEEEARKFSTAAYVSLTLMFVEIAGGYMANSLAIMTDAMHLLSDVGGFAVGVFTMKLMMRRATARHSFGFQQVGVLGALLSVGTIWLMAGGLMVQGVRRLFQPEAVDGKFMSGVAALGLVCNLLMIGILGHEHAHGPGGCSHGHGHGHDHGHSDAGCSGHGHGEHGHGEHSHEDGHGEGAHCCAGHAHDEETGHAAAIHGGHEGHGHGSGQAWREDLDSHGGHGHSHHSSHAGHSEGHSHGQGSHCEHSQAGHQDLGAHGGHGHDHSSHAGHSEGHSHGQGPHCEHGQAGHQNLDAHAGQNHHSSHGHGSHLGHEGHGGHGSHGGHGAHSDHSCSGHGTEHQDGHGPHEDHDDRAGGSESSLAMQAAMIHIIGDMVQSVGVVIAGLLIWLQPFDIGEHCSETRCVSNWVYADPICTLAFTVGVVFTTIGTLRNIVSQVMLKVPDSISPDQLKRGLLSVPGVLDMHDLHIWQVGQGTFLTSHVRVSKSAASESMRILNDLINVAQSRFKIGHATFQLEQEGEFDPSVEHLRLGSHTCRMD